NQQELLAAGEEHQHHGAEHAGEEREARAGGREDVALQQVHHLRVTMRVDGQEEDGERRRDRVGYADARLHGLAPAPLERGEHEEANQREGEGAHHGERPLAQVAVLVRAHGQPVADERERDTRGRELRQRDAQEDHPPEHEVGTHERTDDAHQHAADERVAQEEVGAKHVDERAHLPAATAPKTSAMCSGESSSSAVPFTAPPSSTQMTERTTCRTMRSWWLTRTTVRPRSRFKRVITSMMATVAPGSTPAVGSSR